jgi:hypothetical protein
METMRTPNLALAILIGAVVGMLGSPAPVRAADPDWKAVEQALGKPGQLQDGDVFRVGMPRTDLSVTVRGVPVKAGFALGSYAAFKQVGESRTGSTTSCGQTPSKTTSACTPTTVGAASSPPRE